MPPNNSNPFTTHPLTAPLLADKSYTQVPQVPPQPPSPSPSPSPKSPYSPSSKSNSDSNPPKILKHTWHDPFFLKTTSSSTATALLRATFLFRTSTSPSSTPTGHLLLHLGPDICGQPGIAHGGFLATVLDEVCGNLINYAGLDGGVGMFTGGLDVKYKRPVLVDDREGGEGTVIVATATARVGMGMGRKVVVEGVIRDSSGEVCTTAEAVFVKKRGEGVL
ncbi:HotDog domain-containing protein [Aspergillus cavernicola]|uniref:HotDog domain-containing protein n=1 Tax=Aspergillus cavernicola TaxID=176166 RepID=A0ABR4HRS4_9EURO